MRADRYQIALIILGLIATVFLALFLYREIFPEYRIYQNDYVALEEFRSTYSGEPPPEFKKGVKQIVFEREDKGPPAIDRCMSCHVAVQLPHFSPTKIGYDVNGNIMRSADGNPIQVPNENYVWAKLDQKIADLRDAQVNEHLTKNGEGSKVAVRMKEADQLEALKTAKVGEHVYDVTKVLSMHPLIGKETRPFEFHNVDEYGCTSCHSGNGKGLTTDKAHGPVFDEQYEIEYTGPTPGFTEQDEQNDPNFSHVFNHKPGDSLLFQTSPILVGHLIQSSCIQCHAESKAALQGLADTASSLISQKEGKVNAIKAGFKNEKEALLALVKLKELITQKGLNGTEEALKKALENPSLLTKERDHLNAQLNYIRSQPKQEKLLADINTQIQSMVGSQAQIDNLEKALKDSKDLNVALDQFLTEQHATSGATGTLFNKWEVINLEQALLQHIQDTHSSFTKAADDSKAVSAMSSDIDLLTKDFHRGEQLYLSQACYACHRIAGMSRGGVGPELTRAGYTYPWYLKQKMVWPQSDLKTSTMPNLTLDHEELEDLMTFLLAQKGPTKTVSDTEYKIAIQEWEAGKKMSWEKPIPPSEIHDLRNSMTVFATQGCAACHRLEGFESNIGFTVKKDKEVSYDKIYDQHQWFRKLFPEEILGSNIVKAIENNAKEINKRISDDVRKGSLLEEIEEKYPETIESLYSNFRFASRAKDHAYTDKTKLDEWKNLVHRILMMYVQEYGLGRLIGPRPNWSGVYRSDEWLMEHFHNPAAHVPRSIMPILPFDDSKFYALTYMLDVLGKRNRDTVHAIWAHRGFDPDQAFHLHCAQCHGDYLQGNGPIATWIYPIPKNLRNAEFLRNLTRENAIQSITHGVKGTPMPPWGETPKDKETYDGIPVLNAEQVTKIVDWMFSSLPGATVIKGMEDVPKWHYSPKDVIDELHREGVQFIPEQSLKSGESYEPKESGSLPSKGSSSVGAIDFDLSCLPTGDQYYAALEPKVVVNQKTNQNDEVSDVFDTVPNPIPGGEKYSYYINKKFYTQANVEAGKRFFEYNCAVCHGQDADGSGIRASVMLDAKPRMLTNLDWIKTRDDLRLLRSIKYGVPGTAMTPWGDFTSSLQRMQLVMFIRTLSEEKDYRESLSQTLYSTYQAEGAQVEKARIVEYPQLQKIQAALQDLQTKQKMAYVQAESGSKPAQDALSLYQKQLEAAAQLKQRQEIDVLLGSLEEMIDKERAIYQSIGNDLLTAELRGDAWTAFLKIIPLNGQRFTFTDGKLSYANDAAKETQIKGIADSIAKTFNEKIKDLEKEQVVIEGRFPSAERDTQTHSITAQIASYQKLKRKLLSGIEEVFQLHQQEQRAFQQFEEKLKTLNVSER